MPQAPKSRLFCWGAALSILACGATAAGSSLDDSASTPGRVGLTAALAEPRPVTSVPRPVYADAGLSKSFDRLNAIRAESGLGLLAQQAQLDRAAQSHSDYQARFGEQSHREEQSRPGFTGIDGGARMAVAGYRWGAWTELIAWDDGFASEAVDRLLAFPYHRMHLLNYRLTSVGIGAARAPSGGPRVSTFDLAYAPGRAQGAPGTPLVVIPREGAADIPCQAFGQEWPDPIPENQGASSGYAVSLQVEESRVLSVHSFTLARADGEPVPSKTLSPASDPNLLAQGVRYFASVVPRSPLDRDTRYIARFVGAVDGVALTKTWSFRTAP